MKLLSIVLAAAGALVVAAGTALVYLPAGVILLGLNLVVTAYVVSYVGVRRR